MVIPNLKFGVLKVGHVNSLGNTIWIGIGTFRITLPVPIWMFCISVASFEYPSAQPHVSILISWTSTVLIFSSQDSILIYKSKNS